MLLDYATTGQWKISPPHVLVGKPFTVDHSMICKLGGFITQRHNELRDLEADREFLSMVSSNVEIEPVLQHISSEHLNSGSNKAKDARLDIHSSAWFLGKTSISILRR